MASYEAPPLGTGWVPSPGPPGETKYHYYENGVYTGKYMGGYQYRSWVERAANGVQSLGTGTGTGYSSQAAEGASIASKLKTVTATAGTAAAIRGLKGDTLSWMSRLKSFGLLKGLGTVGLGAASFEVGWKVGGVVADLFFDGTGEPPVPPGSLVHEVAFLQPIGWGDSLKTGNESTYNGAVADTQQFAVYYQNPGGGSLTRTIFKPSACGTHQYIGTPAGSFFKSTGTTECGGVDSTVVGSNLYNLQVAHLPGEVGGSPKETRETAAQTPMPAKEATDLTEQCFSGEIYCGELPKWWWNHDPAAKEATQTEPGVGTGLEPSDPLQVRVPAPGRHEVYTDYAKRLEALELAPETVVLPDEYANPSYGPLEVTKVIPAPKTQLQPGATVRVRYNPATAPTNTPGQDAPVAPGGPGGAWAPPAIPPIDLTPLTSTGLGCGVFPFGLPCYVYDVVSSLAVTPKCPQFDVPLYGGHDMAIDSCVFEPAMQIWRPAFLFIVSISIVWMFASLSLGRGGD